MQEKRKTVRLEKPLVVQYAHNSLDPVKPLIWDSTTTRNISIEGIFLNTSKIFEKNEKLQLRFKIPNDPHNQLEITGEVMESLARKTRIKFSDLDEHQKKIIGDYIESSFKKK